MKNNEPVVGIIMGSDSDWPTMKLAAEVCADLFAELAGLAVVEDAAGERAGHQRAHGRQVPAGPADHPATQGNLGGRAQREASRAVIERIDGPTVGPGGEVGHRPLARRSGHRGARITSGLAFAPSSR